METKQPQNQVNEAAEQAAALKKAQTIKIAKYASVAVLAIVAVVLIYVFAVYKPAVESGNEAIGQADVALIEAEFGVKIKGSEMVQVQTFQALYDFIAERTA